VACAGKWPLRSGRLKAACEPCEEGSLGASGGEGDADAGGAFGDARGDFDQAEPRGCKVGNGERLRPGDPVA
jgi:hypothetical protein